MIPPKFKKFQDYCSNFPDKVLGKRYSYCCYIHDIHYSEMPLANGSKMTRLTADNALFKCVREKRGIIVASLMWIGVRIFGGNYYRR